MSGDLYAGSWDLGRALLPAPGWKSLGWVRDYDRDRASAPTPAESIPIKFKTGYMDRAIEDLAGVIEGARSDLADVEFDTLVGTGFSGAAVVPALALALGKSYVLVRKPADGSHHGASGGTMLGELGRRWVFVDDIISSGATRRRVLDAVDVALADRSVPPHRRPELVGDYLYATHGDRWRPRAACTCEGEHDRTNWHCERSITDN